MRHRHAWQRVVVDTAHDDDGFYFCIDDGDLVGPFVTELDRDHELHLVIAALRRQVEASGGQLRASSGGSWLIVPAEELPTAA